MFKDFNWLVFFALFVICIVLNSFGLGNFVTLMSFVFCSFNIYTAIDDRNGHAFWGWLLTSGFMLVEVLKLFKA